MSERFDQVSVVKQANVHFDGRCVSHTLHFPDGSRKSVGVILPARLSFTTAAPEVTEILAGRCRVRLAGATHWQDYAPGDSLSVPADSGFDIEALEAVHDVCHFG